MPVVVRYGIIAAAILALVMFGPYFIVGARPEWMGAGQVIGYTAMVLCLTATYFAMRQEQQRRGADLRYGSAFGIGVAVAGVAALVFGLATFGFFQMIGDALPQALMDFYAKGIRESGGSPQAIATQLAKLEEMRPMLFNRPLQGAIMAATVFVTGVVESAIAAWLVSRPTRTT